ncbi:MAG: cupin domain-containing protein [Actinomycetales bacterium]
MTPAESTRPEARGHAQSEAHSEAHRKAQGRGSGGALAACLSVPVVEFARDYWGQQPLLSRAATLPALPPAPATPTGRLVDLLTLDDADELLSQRGLRTPFVRLARDGQLIAPSAWTGGGGTGAAIGDQVHDDRVAAQVIGGTTVVLQGLHRTSPAVLDFATRLAGDLGHPVQANAYITPPQSRGFSPHYDVHDVFVIQLSGRKRWRIHPPVRQAPLRDEPWTDRKEQVAAAAEGAPFLEAVFEPGDVLYLPRGWIHAADALGETSMHLTVGVHPVTAQSVVQAAAERLRDDERLRRSLPAGLDLTDEDTLRALVDDVLVAMREAVQGLQPDDLVTEVRRRHWGANRPEPLPPLAQSRAAAALDETTRVRWRGGLPARVVDEGSDDAVRLELPGRTMHLPAVTAAALRDLVPGDPRTVGELPGLDADDAVTLVRRLLTEGVLLPA